MVTHPRLIFRADSEAGKLKLSFTGAALEGIDTIDLGNSSPDAILSQVEQLASPTGIIEVELPNEPHVRNIAVPFAERKVA